jgi:hypothetical protein
MRFEDSIIEGVFCSEWWAFSDDDPYDLPPSMAHPKSFLERIN